MALTFPTGTSHHFIFTLSTLELTQMAALQDREWSLPDEHRIALQVSAYGDGLPSAMRQANLTSMQVP